MIIKYTVVNKHILSSKRKVNKFKNGNTYFRQFLNFGKPKIRNAMKNTTIGTSKKNNMKYPT